MHVAEPAFSGRARRRPHQRDGTNLPEGGRRLFFDR